MQGCPEEVGNAQDRFGDVQDQLGMLRASACSSPRGLLSWCPCLAGILCHGGPPALLVQAAMPGAAEELREEVLSTLLATAPIGPALLLWLCPGRWWGLAYSSCLRARE